MARIVCKHCGNIVLVEEGRTYHLKHVHKIQPYEGIVRDNFLHPWEAEAMIKETVE